MIPSARTSALLADEELMHRITRKTYMNPTRGQNSVPGQWRWVRSLAVSFLLCLCLLFAASTSAQTDEDEKKKPEHEPTVTSEESRILQEASRTAETDLDRAISTLKQAIEKDSSAALPYSLAAYYHRAGETEKAAQAYEQALERMEDFHQARLNLAQLRMQQADYKQAAEQLAMLLDSDYSGKGKLWNLMGRCRLAQGQDVAAEGAYRNALIYLPDSREARTGLIKSLLDQGELGRARSLIEDELELDPLQGNLWKLLASAHIDAGENDKAIRKLECARRLGVADRDSLITLADLLLNEGYLSSALAIYRETAALEDPPAGRLLDAARALASLGSTDEAVNLLDDLKTRDLSLTTEQQAQATLLRAQVAELKGRMDEALTLYKQALKKVPMNGQALMSAGNILRSKGNLEEALIQYERAGRADPDLKARALVRQAQIAVDRAQYEKAVALLEESLTMESKDYVEDYLEQVREAAAAE